MTPELETVMRTYEKMLQKVRHVSRNFGYSVGDDMDAFLVAYEFDDD